MKKPGPVLVGLGLLAGGSCFMATSAAHAVEFTAVGPMAETKLAPDKFLGAVKVSFDLAPTTSMSFDLPWHYCMVAENGLKFANFAAETYDPRRWDGTGADASFEPGMDNEGRYARVWIEQMSAYKTFTIGLPYGVKVQPYGWEDNKTYPFTTWKGDKEPSIGYISAIGHMLNYELVAIYDDNHLRGTMWLANPAIVVRNWNQPDVGIALKLDGATLRQGADYRVGYENTATGKDLVIWVNRTIDLTAAEDHKVAVSITPSRP